MTHEIERRTLLKTVAAAVGTTTVGASATTPAAAASAVGTCDYDPVEDLVFNEISSLLDANYDRLEDEDIVFVFSEDGADAGSYSDEEVPL